MPQAGQHDWSIPFVMTFGWFIVEAADRKYSKATTSSRKFHAYITTRATLLKRGSNYNNRIMKV